MLRRLYDRVLRLAASPRAPMWLAMIAFAESSFFPLPPDLLLIPMALAVPERAFRYALICTVASVVGGLLGYAIGYEMFDVIAQPILHFYHKEDAFYTFKDEFQVDGFKFILLKGVTPIPYKLVTILSGLTHFDISQFILASTLTRGARFFLIAYALRRYGDSARIFIEGRLGLVLGVTAVTIVLGFAAFKFI